MTFREYQKAFLEMLRRYYEEIKDDFRELIDELSLSFEDIASVTYTESSFGSDPELCLRNANPFQIYRSAYRDAISQARKKRIDYADVQEAYLAYIKPVCDSGRVSLNFHKDNLKGALKMFLLYIWRIWDSYKSSVPNIDSLTKFERVMLVYFLGLRCAKVLEGISDSKWDKAASLCVGYRVNPSIYIKRLREGKEKVKEFFRE